MTSTEQRLLNTVNKMGKADVTQILHKFPGKITRTWISILLNRLTEEGRLARSKQGRRVFYALPEKAGLLGKHTKRKFTNKSLDEDLIFEKMKSESPILTDLKENLDSILRYGFTEMVNNAIEHSQSKKIAVSFNEINSKIIFEVRDFGIGVFRNIMKKKKLKSELEAIQELTKGKTTTLPHSHSGEGIFFTSKISDVFVLDSFDYRFRVDNLIKDVFIEKIKPLKGTLVRFEISKSSTKRLNKVFFEYEAEPGSYSFDKTRVYVKLFKAGTVYISRSQAKRLIANLEKFKLVILDFEGIKTIGQAFADEVCRVFLSKHPRIKIRPINTSETVKFMIDRVDKPK